LRQHPQVVVLLFTLGAQLMRSTLPFGGKDAKIEKESILTAPHY